MAGLGARRHGDSRSIQAGLEGVLRNSAAWEAERAAPADHALAARNASRGTELGVGQAVATAVAEGPTCEHEWSDNATDGVTLKARDLWFAPVSHFMESGLPRH